MKATQSKPEFQPITITIESEDEFNALCDLVTFTQLQDWSIRRYYDNDKVYLTFLTASYTKLYQEILKIKEILTNLRQKQ